jgi:hypothetical protein
MSPDLQMRILIRNLDWDRADRIAHATEVDGAVPIGTGPRRFLFRAEPPSLLSWTVHDLLADSTDPDAGTWDLEPGEMPRLVRTFEILYDQIPEEFGAEVMWVGDEAAEERQVSRQRMLDIVRSGRFGADVRYRIEAALPPA